MSDYKTDAPCVWITKKLCYDAKDGSGRKRILVPTGKTNPVNGKTDYADFLLPEGMVRFVKTKSGQERAVVELPERVMLQVTVEYDPVTGYSIRTETEEKTTSEIIAMFDNASKSRKKDRAQPSRALAAGDSDFKSGDKVHKTVGKCPRCGADVLTGYYGLRCAEKCGMNLNHILTGKKLTIEQAVALLNGEVIHVRDVRVGKTTLKEATFKPVGIEEAPYEKDGVQHMSYQYVLEQIS